MDTALDGIDLPANWDAQLLRAYNVFHVDPAPMTVLTLEDAYPNLLSVGDLLLAFDLVEDPYGSLVLQDLAFEELSTLLGGEDELGLRKWVERLHPRDPKGMFREVRAKWRADQADKEFRTYLRHTGPRHAWRGRSAIGEPHDVQRGNRFDEIRYQQSTDPNTAGEREVGERDLQRTRIRVQNMLDRGAPISQIRQELELDDRVARKRARKEMRDAEWLHEDQIGRLGKRLDETDDPREKMRLQQMIDWHNSRLRKHIFYNEPTKPGEPARQPIPLPPPLPPFRPTVWPSVHRPGIIVGDRSKGILETRQMGKPSTPLPEPEEEVVVDDRDRIVWPSVIRPGLLPPRPRPRPRPLQPA